MKKNQCHICSHCDIKGHVVDRCYKLHYPYGYKFWNPSNSHASSIENNTLAPSKPIGENLITQSSVFSSLNSTQYAQLMEMISSHLTTAKLKYAIVASVVHTLQVSVLILLLLLVPYGYLILVHLNIFDFTINYFIIGIVSVMFRLLFWLLIIFHLNMWRMFKFLSIFYYEAGSTISLMCNVEWPMLPICFIT